MGDVQVDRDVTRGTITFSFSHLFSSNAYAAAYYWSEMSEPERLAFCVWCGQKGFARWVGRVEGEINRGEE